MYWVELSERASVSQGQSNVPNGSNLIDPADSNCASEILLGWGKVGEDFKVGALLLDGRSSLKSFPGKIFLSRCLEVLPLSI